jgi:hypothetical protein
MQRNKLKSPAETTTSSLNSPDLNQGLRLLFGGTLQRLRSRESSDHQQIVPSTGHHDTVLLVTPGPSRVYLFGSPSESLDELISFGK